jgi:hypothetical protein
MPFIFGIFGLGASLAMLIYEKIKFRKNIKKQYYTYSQKLERFYDIRTKLEKTTKELKLNLIEKEEFARGDDKLLWVEDFITNLFNVHLE